MLSTVCTRFLCVVLIAFAAFAANAQDENQGNVSRSGKVNYEMRLQILISTTANSAEKLPAELQAVERRLREDFKSNNYQLTLTLLNRVANNGSIESKGVNAFIPNQASSIAATNLPAFYEFTANGFNSNSNKVDEVLLETLRFGLRVPLIVQSLQGEKSAPVTSYEQIGITARQLSVRLNEPTIIGTLTTSRPNELIVLVLTVKSNDSADSIRTARKK